MKNFRSYLIISLLMLGLITLIYGCGGGGNIATTGIDNGSLSNINPPAGKPGTFTLKLSVPSYFYPSGKDITSSVVPYRSTHLYVKIDGEAITTTITDGKALTAGYTELAITNVPVGLNVATIEIRTAANGGGELLAQRKHGFFMPSGGVASVGTAANPLSMGVAISGGACVPQDIDVPTGTILFFENQDNVARTLTTSPASINATIAAVDTGGQPNIPATFDAASYTYSSPNIYNYLIGGTPVSGRVLVYEPPHLLSIVDGPSVGAGDTANDNKNPNDGETSVDFTLNAVNSRGFGTSQSTVLGSVTFTEILELLATRTAIVRTATIGTWADDQITGSVTIPRGKWLVTVSVRGTNTTEMVYYYKGTGTYTVIAN